MRSRSYYVIRACVRAVVWTGLGLAAVWLAIFSAWVLDAILHY